MVNLSFIYTVAIVLFRRKLLPKKFNSRGQGVSKKLFKSTFEVAKVKGFEKLFAYGRGDNERALAAYVKQGSEVVGIAKKHAKVGDVYVDEALIEKFL